jgi:UDP-N-acetylmuramoylalanine--D-glutamate ligase
MKKNATILGLGKSGIAAANLSKKLGYEVFASDSGKKRDIKNLSRDIEVEFGKHSDKVLRSKIIIKSPGIHPDIPILKKAAKQKIEIISELAFAISQSKYKKILAVSGTNGKTTTADLISKIIKKEYKDSIVCGNIGLPLSDKALKTTNSAIIVIEVSSYQLEDTPNFKPDISVLLNITPDHLDHHKSMTKYVKAKKNIFINQKRNDFAVINYDNKICRKISSEIKAKKIFFSKTTLKSGVFYNNGVITIKLFGKTVEIKPKIQIVGNHNIENILAAVSAAYCAGVSLKTIEKVISRYKGVEHRIEFVRNIGGISYYNDSKSTNVDSTRVALEAFNKNILLIMGGRDKGFSYSSLKNLVRQKVKTIFLIGEAASKIKKDLKNYVKLIESGTIKNAVGQIIRTAVEGDVVLLSPACSSFDQFNNFEERGKSFKKEVNALPQSVYD